MNGWPNGETDGKSSYSEELSPSGLPPKKKTKQKKNKQKIKQNYLNKNKYSRSRAPLTIGCPWATGFLSFLSKVSFLP